MSEQESQENNADLALSDLNKRKNAETIIEKWYILQRTIKEGITLEDIISKQQKLDTEKLKNYFKEYYKNKLEIRRTSEEIKRIENNDENVTKKVNMEKEIEHMFLDISEPIKNLLFLFRDNYDYIIALISLITEYDEEDKISSLVELFCNQFYDNILIRNNGMDELLILIYKLLEKEIISMNIASIDEFLGNDTFTGKFISSFLRRSEFKNSLSSIINHFILNLEYSKGDDYCSMSLVKINEYVKEKISTGFFKKEKANNDFDIEEYLFGNINKSSINFKNEEDFTNGEDFDGDEELDEEIYENWNEKTTKDEPKNKNYNTDYNIMFGIDFLEDKINKENNLDLKNFYSYELEKINYDPDIFSNKSIIGLLNDKEYNENLKYIVKTYKDNFIFLKNSIDFFIQLLIDHIDMFPYTLRCICKIISMLLKQKFPSLINYVRNGFVGKFIFDKFIFPIFCLQNTNFLEPKIFSKNTKACLNEIISILKHANQCLLYNNNIESEKTIFNHYLIEIIPFLNKFYEKLIDVDIPPIFYGLLESFKQNNEENIQNSSYNIRKENKKDVNNINKNSSNEEYKPLYNYFNENKEEILNIQCICFSLDDILFILTLIGRNIKAFKHLPDYIFFERSFEFIQPSDYKLDQENTKNPDRKNFFIIFKEEQNSELKNYKKEKKSQNISFSSDETDSLSVCKKFKFCIKKVFKGLNFLNRKDYAYLNMAINSKNFFTAIKNILEEHGEFSLIKSRIPLKWYAEYMYNNIDNLDDKYKFNDYIEIYNEIYNEETNNLEKLKSIISIINIRNRMNMICAENTLEKTKKELIHIEEMIENVITEKFINEENIEVCIQIIDLKNSKNDKKRNSNRNRDIFSKKDKEQESNESKNIMPLLIIDSLNCSHNSNKSNNANENSEVKIPYHAYNIRDFISKFFDFSSKDDVKIFNEKLKKLISNEITRGNKTNQIYKSLNMYMDIIKNHLNNPKNETEIFKELQNKNPNKILGKIKDYITRQIYKSVYPNIQIEDDKFFSVNVGKLQWITPEHLRIKNINVPHLNNAISLIKRFDFYKSIKDKLNCIEKIYINIGKEMKFYYGLNAQLYKEEIKLLFCYIVIKSQPYRMISNINYIKCFADDNEINSYLIMLLESSKEFVNNISYKYLNIGKEEFDKNMKNSK